MRRLAIVLVSVVALSSCWTQRGFDAGNSGSSPLPTSVGTTNVGSLTHAFTATNPGTTGLHAVVSGGTLFAVGDRVYAFDARGCSGPAPATCTPIWQSGDTGGFGQDIVVGGGKVWVTWNPGGTGSVRGYDPAGTRCPTPTNCAPVTTFTTPHAVPGQLRWIGDTLSVRDWVGAYGSAPAHHFLYAYDASGTLRWQADLGTADSIYAPSIAVADGDTVFAWLPLGPPLAFDNRAISNCAGTPKTCQPMWSYAGGGIVAARAGRLYAGGNDAISVFDAHGVDGCSGTPKVCAPVWSTPFGTRGPVTVTSNRLYAGVSGGSSAVFALDGSGCSGSPVVCQPRWTSVQGAAGTAVATGSSEAGGVVYTLSHVCADPACSTTASWYVEAHDATGTVGCSGTPKVCHSLWTQALPFKPDEVMVVGDVVYVVGVARNVFSDPAPSIWGFRTS